MKQNFDKKPKQDITKTRSNQNDRRKRFADVTVVTNKVKKVLSDNEKIDFRSDFRQEQLRNLKYRGFINSYKNIFYLSYNFRVNKSK
ncbi:MAG: hypothetical protein GXO22_03325 [Aquificae bacterium]|nr:hypothetical protein [Aquificota bacterium]